MSSGRRYMDINRTDFPQEVKNLIDEDELKQAVLSEAEKQVSGIAAKEFKDASTVASVADYPGIELNEDEEDEYLLVLEFLQSIGLKYAPAVLRYESQHPEVAADRKEIAKRLELKGNGSTPLLVQLFQERLDEIRQADDQRRR